jgi:predicted regulator of Ras-like GTPase activity (Roadblock/LC7/MglB family)
MDNEVYSFALKNALNEIQSACPEVKSCFLFNEDGDIIAGDEKTAENTIVRVVDSFDAIMEKADAIGGIENITLESANGQVSVSHMNNLYLVTVTSKNADRNLVNTLTRVLVPTVLRLVEKITPAPLKNNLREVEEEPRVPMAEELEKPQETPKGEFGEAQPKQLF